MKQRPFCDQRPSMKTNKLLVRAKVGKVVDTTYDLPPKEYRYGYQAHDDHGVAECLKWPNTFTTSTSKQRSQSARRERSFIQDETNDETGSVTSRNIRRHYDGYDPRNPERFGFEEELCTSKIDPLVLYGPSVAITPEAAKAAVGNISPLGTVVPHPTISPDSLSTTSYSSLYSTRRRNGADSGSDGEYESTYGQVKTSRKIRSKNTTTRGIENSLDAASMTSYRTDCTAIQSPTRIKQPTGMKKIKKNQNRDYIETNKQALRAGCCTAREFDEFKQTHEINVKPEENFKTQEDEYLRVLHKQMVHGIPTPPLTGVKDCLNWAGYKEAKQKALERRERQKERKARNASLKPKGIHYTRAARGHSHKPDPPPSYADTFKIKRFADIDHYAIKDYWGDKPHTRTKVRYNE